jgi:uncharacterized protein DUF835
MLAVALPPETVPALEPEPVGEGSGPVSVEPIEDRIPVPPSPATAGTPPPEELAAAPDLPETVPPEAESPQEPEPVPESPPESGASEPRREMEPMMLPPPAIAPEGDAVPLPEEPPVVAPSDAVLIPSAEAKEGSTIEPPVPWEAGPTSAPLAPQALPEEEAQLPTEPAGPSEVEGPAPETPTEDATSTGRPEGSDSPGEILLPLPSTTPPEPEIAAVDSPESPPAVEPGVPEPSVADAGASAVPGPAESTEPVPGEEPERTLPSEADAEPPSDEAAGIVLDAPPPLEEPVPPEPPPAPPAGIEVDFSAAIFLALQPFLDATAAGHKGLALVRELPERIRVHVGPRPVEVYWMTNLERPRTLRPNDLSALGQRIHHAVETDGVTAFFIEGIEYLVRIHGVERVSAFLQEIDAAARERLARIWLYITPGLLSESDVERLLAGLPGRAPSGPPEG